MRHATIVILIIALLAISIAGCQKQAVTPVQQNQPSQPAAQAQQPTTSGNTAATPTETPVAPTPAETVPGKTMGVILKKLIGLADQKVKSYSFYYAPPPDNLARDRYFIKGNKIHILGYSVNVMRHSDYYDNVYLDTSTKTGVAYCLSLDTRCRQQGQAFEIGYDEVMIKTPYQWIKDIKYGDVTGSESIDDRLTKKVQYEANGVKYTQWIDETYGLPLRVLVEKPGKEPQQYDFKDMAYNGVSDDELLPPVKKAAIY